MADDRPQPGYQTLQHQVLLQGTASLQIRSLLDRQQFADPLGEAAAVGISSAAWPLFGLLWPSGLRLAELMADWPVAEGQRVLEIGCGLALSSLVCQRRGLNITASDCHPLTAHFLRHNLALNTLPPLPYRHGDWASAPQRPPGGRDQLLHGRFDLIIGSDLLYERDERGALAAFIERHAAPLASVLIVDPDRGNRPAFSRRMAEQGFTLAERRLNTPAQPGRPDQPDQPEQPAYRGRLLHYARGPAA